MKRASADRISWLGDQVAVRYLPDLLVERARPNAAIDKPGECVAYLPLRPERVSGVWRCAVCRYCSVVSGLL